MLMPKRVKHRKQFRGTMKKLKLFAVTRLQTVNMVSFAAEPCWIRSNLNRSSPYPL